jgi:hypothetical protein
MRSGGFIEGSFNVWEYTSSDGLNTILGAGYFTDGASKGMQVGDIVWVVNQTAPPGAGSAQQTPSVIRCQCIASTVTTTGGLTQRVGSATIAAADLAVNFTTNPRNILDGGDASINPWQRGTSITNIGATNTYTADRWFMVGGAGTSASMTKTARTTIPGFTQSFLWGRGQSSGSVSTVFLGQALESNDSYRAQGQQVTFSFYAAANTGFAAGVTSSIIGVTVVQGFGTDQGASALVNGTWTSQANVISATQAITTTDTRYSFSGVVSSTATQLGVTLQYTPTSTTALAAETIFTNGLQLEIGGMTPFEHREVEQELAYCQRYYFQANETGTSGSILAAGMVQTTNSAVFVLNLPVQMRAAPTVTVTNGSFGAVAGGSLYVALTSMAAGATHTVNYVSVTGLATLVSGQAAMLVSSSATAGKIQVSADL